MNIVFYVSAVVAVAATVMVVVSRYAIHAVLYLALSLLAVALVFFSLGAPLVAALEVIIYAGAIIVVFVFVVMMINVGPHAAEEEPHRPGLMDWRGPAILAAALVAEVVYVLAQQGRQPIAIRMVSPQQVGAVLLSPYLLGLEMASLVLLAGMIGAYHIGRRLVQREHEEEEEDKNVDSL